MRKQEETHLRARKKGHNSTDESPNPDFTLLEYAINRKILEAPLLELTYYSDAVGEVPSKLERGNVDLTDPINMENTEYSPEWGLDLIVKEGFFRYGPWADRQRQVSN